MFAAAPPRPKTQLQLKLTKCPGCLPPVNANLCPHNATAASAGPPATLAEVPAAANASPVEVHELDGNELDELLRELNVGVIGRRRILKEREKMVGL